MQKLRVDSMRFSPEPINKSTCGGLHYTFMVETPGAITATPLQLAGQLFVSDRTGTVFSLKCNTNQLLWQRKIFGVDEEKGFVYPGCVDNNGWFLADSGPCSHIFRIRRRDGDILWRTPLSEDPTAGLCAPMLQTQHRVYALVSGSVNSMLTCFSKEMGQMLYSIPIPAPLQQKEGEYGYIPLGMDINETRRRLFITCKGESNGLLLCLDPFDGSEIYRHYCKENLSSAPVCCYPDGGADLVLMGSDNGNCHCHHQEDGEPVWHTHISENAIVQPPCPAIGQLYLYGQEEDKCTVCALSVSGQIQWRYDDQFFTSSPGDVCANLYVLGDDNGNVNFYDLTSGEMLVRTEYGGVSITGGFAIWNTYLYCGCGAVEEGEEDSASSGLLCFSIY